MRAPDVRFIAQFMRRGMPWSKAIVQELEAATLKDAYKEASKRSKILPFDCTQFRILKIHPPKRIRFS